MDPAVVVPLAFAIALALILVALGRSDHMSDKADDEWATAADAMPTHVPPAREETT